MTVTEDGASRGAGPGRSRSAPDVAATTDGSGKGDLPSRRNGQTGAARTPSPPPRHPPTWT